MIKVIHNLETGEVIEREFTAKELKEIAESKAIALAEAEVEATKTAEKAALLERLGINEDEAKLLLS